MSTMEIVLTLLVALGAAVYFFYNQAVAEGRRLRRDRAQQPEPTRGMHCDECDSDCAGRCGWPQYDDLGERVAVIWCPTCRMVTA